MTTERLKSIDDPSDELVLMHAEANEIVLKPSDAIEVIAQLSKSLNNPFKLRLVLNVLPVDVSAPPVDDPRFVHVAQNYETRRRVNSPIQEAELIQRQARAAPHYGPVDVLTEVQTIEDDVLLTGEED